MGLGVFDADIFQGIELSDHLAVARLFLAIPERRVEPFGRNARSLFQHGIADLSGVLALAARGDEAAAGFVLISAGKTAVDEYFLIEPGVKRLEEPRELANSSAAVSAGGAVSPSAGSHLKPSWKSVEATPSAFMTCSLAVAFLRRVSVAATGRLFRQHLGGISQTRFGSTLPATHRTMFRDCRTPCGIVRAFPP